MKKLIIVNGTMGVGKSAICKDLYKEIDNSVWLDGDWCWMMHPWDFCEENKNMVIDNITHILCNYLLNSNFKYIIFSWVINKIDILNLILDKLNKYEYELILFTIICSKSGLKKKLNNRGENEDFISKSFERLEDYKNMNTIKIDSDNDISMNIHEMKQIIQNK
jgi:hypothetical protein